MRLRNCQWKHVSIARFELHAKHLSESEGFVDSRIQSHLRQYDIEVAPGPCLDIKDLKYFSFRDGSIEVIKLLDTLYTVYIA